MSEAMLKECPFCKTENPKIWSDDFGYGKFKVKIVSWWIQCQAKDCHAIQQGSCEENVIRRWNRRI